MNKEDLKKIATVQEEFLRVISKDMEYLARMTKKTDPSEEDKYQSNLIQGAFYLTAYTMASKAFNKMVSEKQESPECDRGQVDYFLDIILEMQKKNMDMEIQLKKSKEDKSDN